MNDFLKKIIKGEPVTDGDIANELHDVCDKVHSDCDNECPVFEAAGGIPYVRRGQNRECSCYKNGSAMLAFLRKAQKEGRF